ncbi:hypothetical protein CRG98_002731 [Punica granatum]|uniref:Uncharacterized protein n=1 Tax=Punica granatum TaxID=22663 RepID=A0A2I0L7S8_PUNGR|nr:hypothetical protein CRG98_002731 [Punica granatum]
MQTRFYKIFEEWCMSLANSLLDKALEAAAWTASLVADFLKELAPKIASMVYEAFTATMEYAKAGIECLQKVVLEIAKFLGNVIMKVAECLWSNYLEAVKYVIEKGK